MLVCRVGQRSIDGGSLKPRCNEFHGLALHDKTPPRVRTHAQAEGRVSIKHVGNGVKFTNTANERGHLMSFMNE